MSKKRQKNYLEKIYFRFRGFNDVPGAFSGGDAGMLMRDSWLRYFNNPKNRCWGKKWLIPVADSTMEASPPDLTGLSIISNIEYRPIGSDAFKNFLLIYQETKKGEMLPKKFQDVVFRYFIAYTNKA